LASDILFTFLDSGFLMFALIILFVIINIIQTWLILSYKRLIRGGVMIGVIEAIEFPILILVIIKAGLIGLLTVVIVEAVQWSTIAFLTLR